MPVCERVLYVFGALTLAGCSTPSIVALSCGDGRVDAPEVCDEGTDNGTPGHCRSDCSGVPEIVSIDGDVLEFLTEVEGERVSGATVTILEHPDKTVVTGDDAHFHFDDIEAGSDVTLVVEHPDFKTTQSATIRVGSSGINPFAVQVVPKTVFDALAALVPLPVEEDQFCVIATTVARMGGSLYVSLRQGAPDVEVSLDPPAPEESGPIYFDESVLPDPDQPATSIDGGVLFYRVPPGEYVMTATKASSVFNEVRFDCRAGLVVNAGPPLGLLENVPDPAYGVGVDRTDDTYSDATDALCQKTAECVNEAAGAIHYPDATVASCQAMFRDTWSFVDDSCDVNAEARDAAKALYVCRATSCDVTLGGDEACTAEEDAFRAAQLAYGACLSGS